MKSPLGALGAIARFIEEKAGWRVVRSLETPGALPEATKRDYQTIRSVRAYTMTSVERQWALINAVRFAVRARIAGDIVECGVWRGGAAMAPALTLLGEGAGERRLWLYDTFTGMTEPGPDDRRVSDGSAAAEEWRRQRRDDGENDWCHASLEQLYPRLAPGGVLIIDDYGYWQGARKAVDEFFAAQAAPILLSRIDETGRIGVKSSGAGAP